MRHSSKKTTTAFLRSIVGVKVEEFASILGVSVASINSVESGRLKLSALMMKRLTHQTGISLKWLADGDLNAKPMTGTGEEFTRQTFERAQASKVHFDKVPEFIFGSQFVGFAARLRAILSSANQSDNFALADYKVGKLVDALSAEFGEDVNESANLLVALPLIESDIAGVKRVTSLKPWEAPPAPRAKPKR